MCNPVKEMHPVGIESFEEIRTDGFYYIDKTGLIRDLLNKRGKVNLFTRPRRFGKSLNMSMLKYFFEYGCDKTLFEGLEISKDTALTERHMGQYPVISISLKSVNGANYATARSLMCSAASLRPTQTEPPAKKWNVVVGLSCRNASTRYSH